MANKDILNIINTLNLNIYGKNIFYVPIRNKVSINNYNSTLLNGTTFDGNKMNYHCWGFKQGPKNKENFNNINPGDYVFFILRDDEGYEIIDSIGEVINKYESKEQSLINWNDNEYELIIIFNNIFVLDHKLRLTKNREKLNNILENVPNEIFHSGYEMFRHWNLTKKLSRTKRGEKLIEEDDLVLAIKNHCGGKYIYSNYYEENKKDIETTDYDKDINIEVDEFYNNLDENAFKDLNNLNVKIKTHTKKDSDTSLSNKNISITKPNIMLNIVNRKIVGLTGEKFIYNMLLCKNKKLLRALSIQNEDDIINIEWSNLGYELDIKNFKDLSIGYDIKIQLKDRFLKLEIKTSFKDSGYYSITRNELKQMFDYKDNYFIVKVNHLNRLTCGGSPEIIVENFPIVNILGNLNRIKSMDIYI